MIPETSASSRPGVSSTGCAASKPTVIIEPGKGFLNIDLRAIWQCRELLYFLIRRDVKVRYKQTVIGAGRAILQPLMIMIIHPVSISRCWLRVFEERKG
jgi:lipopolysaccharide transport system permease protein